tara:strand:- start:881 stop:1999 length:1119 start_codon:yes stop_codon:yes gene_type:complete
MNFVETFKAGQEGKNFGLPTGLKSLDYAIDGVQKKSMYGICAAPKVGKTTLTDFSFVLHPFLFLLEQKKKNPETKFDIQWHYFSYEINRIRKEFDFASFFFNYDHSIREFEYEGETYKMSARYLLGRLKTKKGDTIPVSDEHKKLLEKIYLDRIIPLFGQYDKKGKQIKEGYIVFLEERDNPTGMRNLLLQWYKSNGEFVFQEYETLVQGKKTKQQKIIGYNPDNPDRFHIVITDHIRKLKRERNFSRKEVIDKWIEYSVELRNWCSSSFVHICHLNRGLNDIQRIKYESETLHPTGDDVKDTGNLSEECDYLLTLFNPREEKYKLDSHFGNDLNLYPNYRSIHLVESRDTECPQHLFTQLIGGTKEFLEIF